MVLRAPIDAIFIDDTLSSNVVTALARLPRSVNVTFRLCGDDRICVGQEVCVATVHENNATERCQEDAKLFATCLHLACKRGTTCLVSVPYESPHKVHVGCVYKSNELNRFLKEHNNTQTAAATRHMVPTESDTPVAWCIVITVLSLLPLIVLAAIVIYRFVYKLPRIGREKEELTRLFQTLGYDENTEIYKKVMDWMYGPSR